MGRGGAPAEADVAASPADAIHVVGVGAVAVAAVVAPVGEQEEEEAEGKEGGETSPALILLLLLPSLLLLLPWMLLPLLPLALLARLWPLLAPSLLPLLLLPLMTLDLSTPCAARVRAAAVSLLGAPDVPKLAVLPPDREAEGVSTHGRVRLLADLVQTDATLPDRWTDSPLFWSSCLS